MKIKITTISLLIILLLFSFVCKDSSNLSAAAFEDKKWSFDFVDQSPPEILNEISRVSGVDIIIKGDMEKHFITKSYKDYTIDNILLDMFSNENLAALFNYDDKRLASIKIWILPEGEKGHVIRDYTYNAPVTPVIPEKNQNKPENSTRSRINNIPNLTDSKSSPNSEGKKTTPFVSFKKEDSSNSENITTGNDSDSEVVDIQPLPEIATILGLESPPMPPGLSFSN